MNPASVETLRRAAAHVLVTDVGAPTLDEASEHHLLRVLRLREGETVTVTDGVGRWRECRAIGERLEPVAETEMVERRADPLTIGFAIPKQDRPEWIVQKLTEVGVDRIVLLHAERSVVRWDAERSAKHLVRLGRVAAEALQQSRGVWLPTIEGPVAATDLLPRAVAAEPGGRRLVADDRSVAVGPEGGWSPTELSLAADQVSVGPTVVRVETAAIVAATRMLVHTEW